MKRVLYVVALLLLAASASAAQEVTPKAEVFGGYSYAGEGSHGFAASVAGNVNRWFGLVADVGGQYSRLEEEGIRESIRTHSFLFGPRFSLRRKRVTPFAHALFGTSRLRSEAVESGQTFIFTDTSFAAALGGGLDVKINGLLALRVVQIDYLRTNFFEETQNKGRITAGVVFRFGSK